MAQGASRQAQRLNPDDDNGMNPNIAGLDASNVRQFFQFLSRKMDGGGSAQNYSDTRYNVRKMADDARFNKANPGQPGAAPDPWGRGGTMPNDWPQGPAQMPQRQMMPQQGGMPNWWQSGGPQGNFGAPNFVQMLAGLLAARGSGGPGGAWAGSHYGMQGTPMPFGNQPVNRGSLTDFNMTPAFVNLMDMIRQRRMQAPQQPQQQAMGMNAPGRVYGDSQGNKSLITDGNPNPSKRR